MFIRNGIYTHHNCLDMAILVANVAFVGPEYTKLKVFYVSRRNPTEHFFSSRPEEVKIVESQYHFWERMAERA